MFDYLIIGCGFTGSIIARKIAEEKNKKVLILERRNHIAGNMYDVFDENNILIQKYGPHVFYTDEEKVYSFIQRFATFEDYSVIARVCIEGTTLPSPFNFEAIDTFYSKEAAAELKAKLLQYFNGREVVTVIELLNAKDQDIKEYAQFLFEKDYRPYTMKQWGLNPEQIDVSILERCPVFLSYREKYLEKKYECLPVGGFTNMFEKMLDHPNITVELGADCNNVISVDTENQQILYKNNVCRQTVVFTGAIDELLQYRFGQLPYRSLRFDYHTLNQKSFQSAAVVTYPQVPDYTRITEYTKFPYQKSEKTVVVYEYPVHYKKDSSELMEPFYPILNDENAALYEKYLNEIKDIKNLHVCGRLGDYKYYNMDQAVMRALKVADEL
jgi:UDP-galactopyranose mutase